MKKRLLCAMLSAALILSSCSTTSHSDGNKDQPAEETAAPDDESTEETKKDLSDGTPWIDSDLSENLSKDMETDPKDDFHLDSSIDWLTDSKIPDGYDSWDHYAEREDEVKNQSIELLSDTSIEGHDAQLIRQLNEQVLDWDSRNKRGYEDLRELYERILSTSSLEELTDLIIEKADPESLEDLYDFVGISVSQGLNDSALYYPYVGESGLLLSDSAEYSDRTELGDNAYAYRKAVFTYMTGKLGMSQEEAEKRFDEAISFQSELAGSVSTSADRMQDDYIEKTNNEMHWSDIEDMSGAYPLSKILEATGVKYDGIYIVTNPDYFKKMNELFDEAHFEAIKSIVLIYYVNGFAKSTDRDTYDFANEKSNEIFGTEGTVSDEEMAYDIVKSTLSVPMQKVYVQKYGSEEDKKKIEDVCRQVIDTYRKMLEENEWLSEETRDFAIKKLETMSVHAAYPDVWAADYSEVTLDEESLVASLQEIDRFDNKQTLAKIGKERDTENWVDGFDLLSCNAFHNPSDNSINIIIGMMGEPFYSSDMSTEELYASLGAFWIGHEVSHAFDSIGSQFDANGDLKNWWTDEDLAEFKKRVKKLDNYLDTIVAFNGEHVRGSNVNTEMLADITGLECALRMAEKIDGFDYQAFFKKYAQMNAELVLYSGELSNLTQDNHPLSYLRTNVPVQQFEEFYNAYDVKEGDNMYLAPEDRVLVW